MNSFCVLSFSNYHRQLDVGPYMEIALLGNLPIGLRHFFFELFKPTDTVTRKLTFIEIGIFPLQRKLADVSKNYLWSDTHSFEKSVERRVYFIVDGKQFSASAS